MTREEALEKLSATSAHHRLKAARFLARNSELADLRILRDALRTEPVSYVRAGLKLAIKRLSKSASPTSADILEEIDIPPDVLAQIRTKAVEEVTGKLLHEIASPVGLIASAAEHEIQDYGKSKTKKHVDTLRRIFKAIEQLRVAAAVPKPKEFDLAALLAELVTEANKDYSAEVSLIGAKPMLITSDPALLRLAVLNGIRNAIEAVAASPTVEMHPIIVNWGHTDIDYWVAVLDRGPGLVGPSESAFDMGSSTKTRHSGFGLAIARQAIENLGGTCTLQAAKEGGARFELRWER